MITGHTYPRSTSPDRNKYRDYIYRHHKTRFYNTDLDPVREEVALVSLVPQVLIQVRVRDLLQRLQVVHGDQVAVQVHELDADL